MRSYNKIEPILINQTKKNKYLHKSKDTILILHKYKIKLLDQDILWRNQLSK